MIPNFSLKKAKISIIPWIIIKAVPSLLPSGQIPFCHIDAVSRGLTRLVLRFVCSNICFRNLHSTVNQDTWMYDFYPLIQYSRCMDEYAPFQSMGWILILLGVIFVALPYLTRVIPNIERIPWWIIWVYRSDGFYFATSPLLIFISLLSILYNLFRR